MWATTWEHAANAYVAPLLGIDPVPVGTSVAKDPPRFGVARDAHTALWKTMALRERFAGRSLVWIDDENARFAPFDHDAPSLIVTTSPAIRLTIEQMQQVTDFIRAQAREPIAQRRSVAR